VDNPESELECIDIIHINCNLVRWDAVKECGVWYMDIVKMRIKSVQVQNPKR